MMTGEELRDRRHALGLNQQQFAQALGVNMRTLQNWEIDHRAPSPSMAALLERALRQLEAEHLTRKVD